MQPSNGNTYNNILPPLFSGNKLPDWIQIPTFWTAPLNFGQAVGAKLADLTPYLAGDKVKQYPNLAALFPGAWQAGIWNNKIYGIPVFPTEFTVAGYLYYRADILAKLGIGTPQIKTIDDLFNLGKEINDPKSKRWAFDDIWTALLQPFDIPPNPPNWATNDKGDLLAAWETPNIIEAMNWEAKVVKAGLMNPDAIAQDTNSAKQRFWSGQELITFDGQGAWLGADTQSGQAANKGYVRMAFPFFTASGSGTPKIALANGTEWFSYLNKNLAKSQIDRTAPGGQLPGRAVRLLRVHPGQLRRGEHRLHDDQPTGPVLTATGNKQVAQTYSFLASPNQVLSSPGYAGHHPGSRDIRAAQRQVRLQAAVLRHEHLAAGQPEQRDGRTHVHRQHREHHPGGGPRPEHDRRLPVRGQGVAAQRRQRAAPVLRRHPRQVRRRVAGPGCPRPPRGRSSRPGRTSAGPARPRPARRGGRPRGGSSCAGTGR